MCVFGCSLRKMLSQCRHHLSLNFECFCASSAKPWGWATKVLQATKLIASVGEKEGKKDKLQIV